MNACFRRFQVSLAMLLVAALVFSDVPFSARADGTGVCVIEDTDGDPLTDGYCRDQAIVRLVAGADIDAVNIDFDTKKIDDIAGQQAFLLALPQDSNELQFARDLEADSRVAWAELNFIDQAPEGRPQRFFLRGDTRPRPGSLNRAYAPALMGVAEPGACGTGAGVSVAILDSGYDPSHPAFANTQVRGAWDAFTNQDGAGNVDDIGNDEDDDADGLKDEMTGHGTHVMGIVTQLAPGATIVPIRALNSDGIGQAFYLARAIYRAVGENADVINLSLGSTADTRIVREAVDDAIAAGIFVAAAAGNNGEEVPMPREYPGTQPGVFGVAATDAQDRPAAFASTHPRVSLSAPGDQIVSAFAIDQPPAQPLGSDYALWSGSSMSTPWVSGAAALLLAQNPSWTADDVAAQLRSTAAPINGRAAGMGSGRLDVGAAVGCSAGPDAPQEKVKDKKDDKKKKNQKGKKGKKNNGKNRR